jgi:uncharacterized membrane protein
VIAMYLGRYIRLNSWDAVLAPQQVAGSVLRVPAPLTVVVLAVMFVVVGVGVFVMAAIGDNIGRSRSASRPVGSAAAPFAKTPRQ